ncbi:ABC transporter permease [Paenibacillus koleovorans]|uniref:ABC transporter permease n=1 Tax=Paenibacillus koleovorans TaxID=121608 RepID=UPI001FE9F04B|nr:ABC transporter permease subunit [Paenibacillus koleovorans]
MQHTTPGIPAPARVKRAMPRLLREMYRYRYVYALLLPALAIMIIFRYVPMYGVQIAFKNFMIGKGIMGSEWVGLKQFQRMFDEPTFLQVLRNTLVISGLGLVFGFPAPIFLAIILNEIRLKWFKRVTQTISYLPHFISWVVLAGIIKEILSMNGLINKIITFFGGTPALYLVNSNWFVQILILSGIWQGIGWGSIIYLAAIAGIDKHLYEAAAIDGASRVKQAWHITLPSIMPVVFLMFLLRIGNLLENNFDQIFNLYTPLVYSVGDVIQTYVYRVGLVSLDFSYSAAIGLFQNVIGFILLLVVNFSSRKFKEYGV